MGSPQGDRKRPRTPARLLAEHSASPRHGSPLRAASPRLPSPSFRAWDEDEAAGSIEVEASSAPPGCTRPGKREPGAESPVRPSPKALNLRERRPREAERDSHDRDLLRHDAPLDRDAVRIQIEELVQRHDELRHRRRVALRDGALDAVPESPDAKSSLAFSDHLLQAFEVVRRHRRTRRAGARSARDPGDSPPARRASKLQRKKAVPTAFASFTITSSRRSKRSAAIEEGERAESAPEPPSTAVSIEPSVSASPSRLAFARGRFFAPKR